MHSGVEPTVSVHSFNFRSMFGILKNAYWNKAKRLIFFVKLANFGQTFEFGEFGIFFKYFPTLRWRYHQQQHNWMFALDIEDVILLYLPMWAEIMSNWRRRRLRYFFIMEEIQEGFTSFLLPRDLPWDF